MRCALALLFIACMGAVEPLCIHDTYRVTLDGGATGLRCRKCGQPVAFDWPESGTVNFVLGQRSPNQLQLRIVNIYTNTNQWLDYRAVNIEVLTSHAPVLLGTNASGEYRIRFVP